jgi:hypothetical protein
MKDYILCASYFHIRSLFNDAVRNSDYIASNASFPGGTEENHETLRQYCPYPCRSSYCISSEYKSEGLYAALVVWWRIPKYDSEIRFPYFTRFSKNYHFNPCLKYDYPAPITAFRPAPSISVSHPFHSSSHTTSYRSTLHDQCGWNASINKSISQCLFPSVRVSNNAACSTVYRLHCRCKDDYEAEMMMQLATTILNYCRSIYWEGKSKIIFSS